jgi:hypothetical protein
MPHAAAVRMTSRERDAGRYQRHKPEQTLLYQIVDEYYPAFAAHLAEQGRELPSYVQREFEEFLKCGRLEHGFLRVRCESCHTEHLVAFNCIQTTHIWTPQICQVLSNHFLPHIHLPKVLQSEEKRS